MTVLKAIVKSIIGIKECKCQKRPLLLPGLGRSQQLLRQEAQRGGKQMNFPENVDTTTLRPDLQQIILLEIIVPQEDRNEDLNESKMVKYAELVNECQQNGWRTRCQPTELRFRGSPCRAYYMLGITGTSRQRAVEAVYVYLWITSVDHDRGTIGDLALPGQNLGLAHPWLGHQNKII